MHELASNGRPIRGHPTEMALEQRFLTFGKKSTNIVTEIIFMGGYLPNLCPSKTKLQRQIMKKILVPIDFSQVTKAALLPISNKEFSMSK